MTFHPKLLGACIFVLTLVSLQSALGQDLNVSNDAPFNSVDFLLNNVFTNDDCILIENMTFNGAPSQIGFFNNGNSTISANAGIVIATSTIQLALGPNDEAGATEVITGPGSDPDLEDLIPNNSVGLFDVTILEFDFTPDEDVISFNYVFASEEYPEYVCTVYNDVFGFFLSGPGINGPYTNNAENIATLTNGDVVAINSVNNGSIGSVAIGGTNYCTSLSNDEYYVDNADGSLNTQYDGFTEVLTATSAVIPCETYHIKIAITDVGDALWDSAVFLEAASFGNGSAGFISSSGTIGPVDSEQAIEGCVDGYILFERTPGSPLSDPFVIELAIGGTATPGIDYTPTIPTSITIPAGESSVQFDFSATADGNAEGTETIEVQVLTVNCECDLPTDFVVEIIEVDPPEILDFDPICSSETSTLDLSDFVVDNAEGTWGGPGVSGTTFDATVVSGPVLLTFAPEFPCHDFIEATVIVEDPIMASLALIPDICLLNATAVDLNDYNEDNVPGTWSGSGVTGDSFNPVGLTGDITLTFTPTADCSEESTTEVSLVDSLDPLLSSFDPICEDAGPLDLSDYGDQFVPGVWSGEGVSGTDFDPVGLEGDIVLTYTPDDECGEVETETINILPVVVPDLLDIPSFCETDGLIDLTEYEDAAVAGEWQVDGNTDFIIDPLGNAGTIPVSFIPDAPCSEAVGLDVVIDELTEVMLEEAPSPCEGSTTLIDLSVLVEAGVDGAWSGDGVSGSDFDPTGLSGTIGLTFTPEGSCVEAASIELDFIDAIDLSLSDLPLACADNASDVALDDLLSDALTGNWSGPGVVGDSWNAEGLSGEVILTFTPDDDCAEEVSVSTLILQQPEIVLGAPICISATEYEVSITVSGEAGASYALDTNNNTGINPSEIDEGETLTLVFTNEDEEYAVAVEQLDAANCIDYADIITPICDCPTADPIAVVLETCIAPSDLALSDYDLENLVNEDYLNTDDDDMNGIDWFDNQNPSVGDDVLDLAAFNWPTSECETSNVTFYPFMRCDLLEDGFDGSDDDVYVPVGMLEVIIYPDLSTLNIEIDESEECCPFVDGFDCDDFSFFSISNSFDSNGAQPDCSDETGVGDIEFTLVNESLPASIDDDACSSIIITAAYSCINCPSVLNLASGLQVFCDTDNVDLSNDATGLEVETAINPTEAFVTWHVEDDPMSDTFEPGSLSSSDLCLSETFEIYAFLNCDLEGNGFDGGADDTSIAAGSISIEVYPDLTDLVISIEDEGACCPFVSAWDCSDIDGFEITNSYDNGAETPDCSDEELSGNIVFTLTQTNLPTDLSGGACESVTNNTTFNCTVCPDVIQPATGLQYFCGEVIADLSDAATGLEIEEPVGTTSLEVNWYMQEGTVPSEPFVPGSLPAATACDPVASIIYAYLECDVNGDGFNGGPDDNYIAAGFVEVVSYPQVSDLVITIDESNECCPIVSSWDCMDNENFTISNDYDNEGATPDCSAEDEAGTITFTVAQINLPAAITDPACTELSETVGYNCSECPAVTPVMEALVFCEIDDVGIQDLPIPSIDEDSSADVTIAYYLDNSTATPSQEYIPGDLQADNCNTLQEEVFVYVLCDLNNDGFSNQADDIYIEAGVINITVYPALTQPVLTANGDCTYTITTDCPDDQIDPESPFIVALGDDASVLNVSVMSSDSESICDDLLETFDIPACPEFIEPEVFESDIELPTAFSPNGDGLNDFFRPITNNIKNYELHIYDRWGKEVYTTTVNLLNATFIGDLQEGWDGTYQNTDCEIGVFAFYLVAYDLDDDKWQLQGNVTLIR